MIELLKKWATLAPNEALVLPVYDHLEALVFLKCNKIYLVPSIDPNFDCELQNYLQNYCIPNNSCSSVCKLQRGVEEPPYSASIDLIVQYSDQGFGHALLKAWVNVLEKHRNYYAKEGRNEVD